MSLNMRYTNFDHTALLPVRSSLVGEAVFSEAWKKLMTTPVDEDQPPMLEQVLDGFQYTLDLQDAKVLASVVTWLGTHCGKTFLDTVRDSQDQDRFLKAWSAHNKRVRWASNGRRALESILYGPDSLAPMTLRQHDAVECLMSWLGQSVEAQAFLQGCEAEIIRRDKEAAFVHYLTANCQLGSDQANHVLRLAKGLAVV